MLEQGALLIDLIWSLHPEFNSWHPVQRLCVLESDKANASEYLANRGLSLL